MYILGWRAFLHDGCQFRRNHKRNSRGFVDYGPENGRKLAVLALEGPFSQFPAAFKLQKKPVFSREGVLFHGRIHT